MKKSGPERKTEGQGESLLLLQRRLVITTLCLLIGYLAVQLAVIFSDILRILAISIFFTYTVSGFVDSLEKACGKRILAVLAVYGMMAVLTILGIVLLVPAMMVQLSELINSTINQLPLWADNLGAMSGPLEATLARYHLPNLQEVISSLSGNLPRPDGNAIVGQMGAVAMSTMTWIVYGLSVMVLTFYFLQGGSSMVSSLVGLLPEARRGPARTVLSEINISLHAFFRGQIVLGLLFGVFMVVVYMVLGVQYALALGLFLGVWEIVPVIGPTLGFLPALLSVLLSGMSNLPADRIVQVLILLVVFNVMQWIKDNIVAPRYIGDAIGLHPVLIFLAIMIGARLDGMLGIIVSLPVAGALGVLFRHLIACRRDLPAEADSPQG
ncbi:MAG: AI-2E family transporter [Candidatus Obscuribacterales bacterium]